MTNQKMIKTRTEGLNELLKTFEHFSKEETTPEVREAFRLAARWLKIELLRED